MRSPLDFVLAWLSEAPPPPTFLFICVGECHASPRSQWSSDPLVPYAPAVVACVFSLLLLTLLLHPFLCIQSLFYHLLLMLSRSSFLWLRASLLLSSVPPQLPQNTNSAFDIYPVWLVFTYYLFYLVRNFSGRGEAADYNPL